MEFNKLAAAVLIAGLIGMGTGKISGFLYGGADESGAHHAEGEHEVARGYSIDVPEGGVLPTAEAAEAEELASIVPLLSAADTAAGEAYFAKKCALCHDISKGGPNKTGPNLWGIVGRSVASASGFGYSKAMAEHGGNWSFDELNGFLHKPKKYISGTIMAFAGVKKDDERANLIAYLNSQSDAPKAIPAQ